MNSAEPDLKQRSASRFWAEERVRFSDLDALGHVNNNAFGVYFETGRIAFMTGIGARAGPADHAVVVAHLEIDFLAELFFPAALDIGLSVLKLGGSSVTLGMGLFQGERCHATSKAVMVRVDKTTRRSKLLTDVERTLFEPYLMVTHA